jgi:3-deoxy-D-manno-octulosonic-acid transferase
MGRLVYNCLLTLGGLLALPFIGLALLVRPRYRLGLAQRLSRLPPIVARRLGARPVLWLHAPSVGESLATRPFLRGLKAQFPDATVVLSVLTPTAYSAATSRLPEADVIIYFPLDHPVCVKRTVRQIRPSVFFLQKPKYGPTVCLS